MFLQAPHCPSCGAPVDVPSFADRVTCTYCSTTLIISTDHITTEHTRARREDQPTAQKEPYLEPEATLRNWATPRFELSLIEQGVPDAITDIFSGIELSDGRFAFISARVVNAKDHPVVWQHEVAFNALKTSLESDGDPGLAANLALEALCAKPFEHRFQCAIALFDSRHMTVIPYSVGTRESIVWASSEEGRAINLSLSHSALERKSLRERGSHFTNGSPIHLTAGDLVVFASPGFLAHGTRPVFETLNAHWGEAPLRIVTLAKNGYWTEFQRSRDDDEAPAGNISVVAVRPRLPEQVKAMPAALETKVLSSRKYEVALATRRGEQARIFPLHDDRQVVVWLSPTDGVAISDAELKTASDAILALLDRRDYGDNENPRQAGRDALAALGERAKHVRLAVIQLFDRHQRVKYFRAGWQQPLALGPRGEPNHNMQQFDEGGEVTIADGARLFFPGTLAFDGEHSHTESFATAWPGGKASRLFEALVNHWKTKKAAAALESMVMAAMADAPSETVSGVGLVSSAGR